MDAGATGHRGNDDAVARLRSLLAGSMAESRPRTPVPLPEAFQSLLTAEVLAGLRPAAVLIPVVRHAGGDTILLTRRAETLRQHTGQISFPGGGRDAGDASFAATALRETREEVGLDPATIEVIGYLDDYPTLTGYCITPVVGLVTPPLRLAPDPREVHSVFELPLADVLDRGCFEFKRLSRGPVAMEMPELSYGGHRIWGATAAILWHLHEQLAAGHD